ncbi:FkbM family methyltransferase [Ulvibacter sp. MAR_2010_11]|uniref:FkbM family methyltransferase n=1 Tax=Ulvibacter sp. MAR_2010_11 TaxID=1250229 RepID=UPI000C2C5481|nr:FkbM family methyltransferase [Ulvibacter sp. MAR_2010_11]PKA82132.1 FkbM family methyltransferase [Ulvibacter sp. MAR_2010_11]
MKKLVKRIARQAGYKISRIDTKSPVKQSVEKSNPFSTQEALYRCQKRNLKIKTVIDVGASDGRWSGNCMRFFPDAHYFLVEAQNGHLEGLKHFESSNENVSFVLAAAGKENGTIYFNNSELFGGIASETPFEKNSIEVPVISLDVEIEKRDLQPPFLLKLDTHGFEVPILEGAKKVISHANLIIIEAYNFNIESNSLCFWELCEYMGDLGFRPLEVVDLMAREYDQAFWQMDIFFIKKDDPMFNYIQYR